MKLTGKSLEQFENYLMGGNQFDGIEDYDDWDKGYPECMKFGMLVDFFDSVGISIEILENTGNKWKGYINKEFKGVGYDSRPQARAKAIERANEILNKR